MSTDDLRPDIASAKQRMRTTMGSGKEIKRLIGYLWDDEQVERMTKGSYGVGTGLLVLTDRRLVFLKDGTMSKTSEDFPLEKISSVQWSSGLMLGTITIFASGNKAEIKNVNKDDGKEITDQIRHRLSAPKAVVGTGDQVVQPPALDIPDQLRKLGELRNEGIVTQEEFEAKKADLLSRM